MNDWKDIRRTYRHLELLYYRNKVLLGIIQLITLLGALFLMFISLQHYYYFSSTVRSVLFYLFSFTGTCCLYFFVLKPLLQLSGIFSGVGRVEMNEILQKHFPDLEDRFLNMFELIDEGDGKYSELVEASIAQKFHVVRKFRLGEAFNFAIPLMSKWGIVVVGLSFVLLGVLSPSFIYKGYYQYTHFHQEFSPAPDFSFVLLNDSLTVKKGSSFIIKAAFHGHHTPGQLSIVMQGNRLAMERAQSGGFRYTFGNVYHNLQFQLSAAGYFSDLYELKCLPVPIIRSFTVEVQPPSYTKQKGFVLQNQGDIEVPEGSKVSWLVHSVDADSLVISFGNVRRPMFKRDAGYQYEFVVKSNTDYFFSVANQYFHDDGLVYRIKALKDQFPEIKVRQVQDSVTLTSFYFRGMVSDDYGLEKVKFHVTGQNIDSSLDVSIHPNVNPQTFFYGFNFSGMKPGAYQYWFTVADNDQLHHYKDSQSEVFSFRFPGFKEIEETAKSGYDELQEHLTEGKVITDKIQQAFENMRTQMLSGQLTDWEKKKITEGVKSQSEDLKKLMNTVQEENRKLNRLSENFSSLSPALVEKQKQVEKLMDELYSDDLKKLFDEFNSLLNNFGQKKYNELTKDLQFQLDDLNKQLDRNLALLKKLRVQKSVEEIQDNLLRLSQNQDKLTESIQHSKRSNIDSLTAKLANQSKDINQTFSMLDSAMKENQSLEKPYSLDKSAPLQEKIQDDIGDLKNSGDSGNKGRKSSLSEGISKSLKAIAQNLNNSMLSSQMEIDWVQIRRLQYLSDNILDYSFQQEALMRNMTGISTLDPGLTKYLDTQRNLVQFEEALRDTLSLLAKQAPQISFQVNKESLNWKYYTDRALSNLEEGKYAQGVSSQQFSMTSANNLALYLSEILQQVKEMMKNAQPGDGSCNKPGGSNSSIPSLAEIQQKLKQQLESMMNDLKNGAQPGNDKIGRLLMQQEIIQQAIQQEILKGDLGPDIEKQLKAAERLLQQNRQDLLTKNVTQQTVNRQNLIFEHLLEAQNAKIERNSDNERESQSAKNQLISNPKSYFKTDEDKDRIIDIISNSVWRMNSFYQEKFNSYLKEVNGKESSQPATKN